MELSWRRSIAADFGWSLPPITLMLPPLVTLCFASLVTIVAALGRTGTSGVSMRVIVHLSNEISTLIESPTICLNAWSIFFLKSNVPVTLGRMYLQNQ